MDNPIRYLVFDIESVPDNDLIKKSRFADVNITPKEATEQYKKELLERKGSDFIPYTMQEPVSLVLGSVSKDYRLQGEEVLRIEELGAFGIARTFWKRWVDYGCPKLITFNGRGFDMPMMETMAFKYGIPVPEWFKLEAKSYFQPRYRFNHQCHMDLYDILSNYDAKPFTGGLNLAAKMIKMPGKMKTDGCQVQCLYEEGRLREIHEYCQCDVLDTYFIFLRIMLLCGKITVDDERRLVKETLHWITDQSKTNEAFREYLNVLEKNGISPWNP